MYFHFAIGMHGYPNLTVNPIKICASIFTICGFIYSQFCQLWDKGDKLKYFWCFHLKKNLEFCMKIFFPTLFSKYLLNYWADKNLIVKRLKANVIPHILVYYLYKSCIQFSSYSEIYSSNRFIFGAILDTLIKKFRSDEKKLKADSCLACGIPSSLHIFFRPV